MPTYEFMCEACKQSFDVVLTAAERGTASVQCPACGSADRHAPHGDIHREDLSKELKRQPPTAIAYPLTAPVRAKDSRSPTRALRPTRYS